MTTRKFKSRDKVSREELEVNETEVLDQDVVSNPDMDKEEDRVNTIEEVIEMNKAISEEIEEINEDIEDAEETKETLEKIEDVAQEAIEEDTVSPQLGETTHILLSDLFGRAGVSDTELLPTIEMFKNPKTSKAAMSIAVESISVVKGRIDTSVILANKLVAKRALDRAVAQEAFMDKVRDIFGPSFTKEHIKKLQQQSLSIKKSLAVINQFNLNDVKTSPRKYITLTERPLTYLFKDDIVVKNLSAEIDEDVQALTTMNTFLKNVVNGDVENKNYYADVKSLSDSLNERHFLGNMFLYIVGKKRGASFSNNPDAHSEVKDLKDWHIYSANGGSVGRSSVLSIVMDSLISVAFSSVGGMKNNKEAEGNRDLLAFALTNETKKASSKLKVYEQKLEEFTNNAEKLLYFKEKNRKSDNRDLRDAMRIGAGLVNFMIFNSHVVNRFLNSFKG